MRIGKLIFFHGHSERWFSALDTLARLNGMVEHLQCRDICFKIEFPVLESS